MSFFPSHSLPADQVNISSRFFFVCVYVSSNLYVGPHLVQSRATAPAGSVRSWTTAVRVAASSAVARGISNATVPVAAHAAETTATAMAPARREDPAESAAEAVAAVTIVDAPTAARRATTADRDLTTAAVTAIANAGTAETKETAAPADEAAAAASAQDARPASGRPPSTQTNLAVAAQDTARSRQGRRLRRSTPTSAPPETSLPARGTVETSTATRTSPTVRTAMMC